MNPKSSEPALSPLAQLVYRELCASDPHMPQGGAFLRHVKSLLSEQKVQVTGDELGDVVEELVARRLVHLKVRRDYIGLVARKRLAGVSLQGAGAP